MKRVKATFVVADAVDKSYFATAAMAKGGELENYEERKIQKEGNVSTEHSFDSLMDSTMQLANGLWQAIKGLAGMSKWALIIVWEGLRWLWNQGVGKKKDEVQK